MKKAFSVLGLLAIITGMTVSAAAQFSPSDNASDNSTVNVQVESQVAVDISPDQLNYNNDSGIIPGESERFTAEGFGSVEIENIGSANISSVWLNASQPDDNPFGTGVSTQYDAGNFVMVNSTDEITGQAPVDSGFTYVNRKEFNESNDLSYISTPNETWRVGRFKSGDQEHFWAVAADTNGNCDSDATDPFRVGQEAHNVTTTGSVDFVSGNYDTYTLSSVTGADSNQYVASEVNITLPSGTTRNYDVVVNCGDPFYVSRTQYNAQLEGLTNLVNDGTETEFILNGSTAGGEARLQPGEHFEVETQVEIPQGVASGSVTPGRLRVIVDSV